MEETLLTCLNVSTSQFAGGVEVNSDEFTLHQSVGENQDKKYDLSIQTLRQTVLQYIYNEIFLYSQSEMSCHSSLSLHYHKPPAKG